MQYKEARNYRLCWSGQVGGLEQRGKLVTSKGLGSSRIVLVQLCVAVLVYFFPHQKEARQYHLELEGD